MESTHPLHASGTRHKERQHSSLFGDFSVGEPRLLTKEGDGDILKNVSGEYVGHSKIFNKQGYGTCILAMLWGK